MAKNLKQYDQSLFTFNVGDNVNFEFIGQKHKGVITAIEFNESTKRKVYVIKRVDGRTFANVGLDGTEQDANIISN